MRTNKAQIIDKHTFKGANFEVKGASISKLA
jgi:hypothetical protein